MARDKAFLANILAFLLLVSLCQASSVTRSFSKNPADIEENVTVSIAVSITGGETFYAIDESYPSGLTLMSSSGNASQPGHIKWVVTAGAANTVYSYVIRTPRTPANYTFSGIYMFENMPAETGISGPVRLTVAARGDVNNDNVVNIQDLATVALDFGKTSGFLDPDSDITKNGVVDIFDLVVIGKQFGAA